MHTFCVIYEIDASVKEYRAIKWFKITCFSSEILWELNQCKKGHHHKAFSNFSDAAEFLLNKLDFEDQFQFGIMSSSQIVVNRTYCKEVF